jgi:hypothetical protein
LLVRYLAKRSLSIEFTLPRGADLAWLAGAILFGGVLGPGRGLFQHAAKQ